MQCTMQIPQPLAMRQCQGWWGIFSGVISGFAGENGDTDGYGEDGMGGVEYGKAAMSGGSGDGGGD